MHGWARYLSILTLVNRNVVSVASCISASACAWLGLHMRGCVLTCRNRRYNLCAPVARCLGLEPNNNSTMWKDRAIVEVTAAIMHSFREAGMGECHLFLFQRVIQHVTSAVNICGGDAQL
jgi:nitric oxide synthase oxygenase domain/subunit